MLLRSRFCSELRLFWANCWSVLLKKERLVSRGRFTPEKLVRTLFLTLRLMSEGKLLLAKVAIWLEEMSRELSYGSARFCSWVSWLFDR